MKLKKIRTGSPAVVLLLYFSSTDGTHLTETVYYQITSTNYYNTKYDIIKVTLPPLPTWVLQHFGPRQEKKIVLCRSIGYQGTRWLVV